MTCRAKVNDLDPVGLSERVDQHDVLRLQVCVNQTEALQLHQRCGHLKIQTHTHQMRCKIIIRVINKYLDGVAVGQPAAGWV